MPKQVTFSLIRFLVKHLQQTGYHLTLPDQRHGRHGRDNPPETGNGYPDRFFSEIVLHECEVDDAPDSNEAEAGALDAEEGEDEVGQAAQEQVQIPVVQE